MKISTDRISAFELNNWHETGPFPVDMVYKARQDNTDSLNAHVQSVQEIQKLLAECLNEGKRFRAMGSRWSLNDIAFNNSRVHWNTEMNIILPVSSASLHNASTINAENLIFTQCGATINELTSYLEQRHKSLLVSGGSNGQTIAGAISTGVHGGAFDHQCISDYVKGLHLVTGPQKEDSIYLERQSEPILNEDFANSLNCRVIRDDDLFNAALVSLGSFGFIAAIILQVEDIYSLKRYIKNIEYNDAMQLMSTLDFEHSEFSIDSEKNAGGKPKRPYHFKTYVNQYTKQCVAEVIYKIPFQKSTRPEYVIKKEMHPDLFRYMNWLVEKTRGNVVKLLTRIMQGNVFPNPKKETKPVIGTLGDTFHSVDYIQPGFSWAFGVDSTQLKNAMEVWLSVFKTHKVPGLSAIKLVRQSHSTLGFTRFPITAVIHMDGVQWTANGDLWPQEQVQKELIKAFMQNGIHFTLHWGKNAAWDYPGLLDYMYQLKDDEWVNQRSRLLRYETADLFSNDFLRRIGLAGYNRSVSNV